MKKLKEHLEGNETELIRDLIKKRGEVKACSNCGGIDLTVTPNSIDAAIGLESLPGGKLLLQGLRLPGHTHLIRQGRIIREILFPEAREIQQGRRTAGIQQLRLALAEKMTKVLWEAQG
jgi:hypothetical protein